MQDDASDMLWYAIKKWLKLGQKNDFLAHFERFFFAYAFLHPRFAPRFCELKDLIKIIKIQSSVAGFISTGYVVVKFKVFFIDSASMKWSLFGDF